MSSEWKTLKLSQACTKISDGTHHSPKVQYSEAAEGRFKYVTSKNVRQWGLDLDDIAYVGEETHREIYSRCNPEINDVLLTKDGVNTGTVVVNTLEEEFSLLSSVALLKPKQDLLDSRYLKYFLESPLGSARITGKMTGTAIRRIILREIKDAEIHFPPLNDQRRIVAEIEKQFSRLDAGVAALKRVQANLKRYRAAVLKAACEGRLVPTEAELARKENRDYEPADVLLQRILAERRKNWTGRGKYKEPEAPDRTNLPELPEGWTWATIDAIAVIKGGIAKDAKREYSTDTRMIPYLRVANVQRGYLDLTEMKEIEADKETINELLLRPGDLLFNEGGDRDKLGRGWVWNGELPECIHQNHVFRARLIDTAVSAKYISWYANTTGQRFFFDEGKHTTNLASISMSKLKGLPIPLPPPIEQARIVTEVERHLSIVNRLHLELKDTLDYSENLRQTIIQSAFTNELRTVKAVS